MYVASYYVMRDTQGEYKALTYNPHLAAWYSLNRGWVIHPVFHARDCNCWSC